MNRAIYLPGLNSIAVEEQFYLFWPHFFRKYRKNLKQIFLFLILIFSGSRIGL